MTDKQINLAIAEACGWKRGYTGTTQWVNDPHGIRMGWSELRDVADAALPDYCNDLNAMHEAEKVLDDVSYDSYWNNLVFVCIQSNAERLNSATARQRAEAFLRTLGKWEEVQP